MSQRYVFLPPSRLGSPSPLLADNIDPKTKDFRNLFEGADPVDDQVQVTVMTGLGSGAAVMDTGVRFSRNKMTSDAAQVLAGDIRQALRRQVRARDIQIVNITFGGPNSAGTPTGSFDESTQTGQINVEYRNLRALDGTIHTAQVASGKQV